MDKTQNSNSEKQQHENNSLKAAESNENRQKDRLEDNLPTYFLNSKKGKRTIVMLIMVLFDMIAVAGSYFLALMLRFDFLYRAIPERWLEGYLDFIPFYLIIVILIFALFKLYRSVWRFASYSELGRLLIASILTNVIHIAGTLLFVHRMPISYYAIGAVLQFIFTVVIRFAYRFYLLAKNRFSLKNSSIREKVMIIGAGSAGEMILRDVINAKELNEVCLCLIDDDPAKIGRYVDGVPIVGGRDDILSAVEKYKITKIYVAMPSVSLSTRREIINICSETNCKVLALPGLYQLANEEVSLKSMKEVAIEDLLGRDPIKVDMSEIFSNLNGKVILVTGGGGSIGSELCRQIASHSPKLLIVFDVYENNAYDLQQELKYKYPTLNFTVIIGSVRDSRKIYKVMETYRPNIVFHAAAHKHVPLMEDSPCEAIKNNVFGTYKTAYAALANGAERFVLISTDKAVNPTNIMGASKRLCEMVIQSFDHKVKESTQDTIPTLTHYKGDLMEMVTAPELRKGRTEFVAVRFGNVLGSNGSVIPLFKKQIERGGPVTVTHPDIIRYFMTIPEAVSLVLQAGAYAKGGEIFVLDMGEPVKIDTLARNLIKLSGFEPDKDIEIRYTGLRPGEKLYEEKLMSEEGLKKTPNDLIHIAEPIDFDMDTFLDQLPGLMAASYENQETIKETVAGLVPTYKIQITSDKE